MEKKSTDLRVIRTKQAIRNALCDMILEMDYKEITVKELVKRAMINRNTFYLHYSSIDELFEEIQDKIVEDFTSVYVSNPTMGDVRDLIRKFFEYITSQSPIHERLLCCSSYRFVADGINKKVAAYRKEHRKSTTDIEEAAENLVFVYCGSVAAIIYQQWVADGKILPKDDLIDIAIKLICTGMESIVSDK